MEQSGDQGEGRLKRGPEIESGSKFIFEAVGLFVI